MIVLAIEPYKGLWRISLRCRKWFCKVVIRRYIGASGLFWYEQHTGQVVSKRLARKLDRAVEEHWAMKS